MDRFLFFCCLCFFLPLQFFAQVPAIQSAINALDKDPAMQSANWGISVIDLQTGELIASHQSKRSLSTASTMKAITSGTALLMLGPDYQFETYLEYTGTLTSDSVLQGDLYIRGTGDPTLGSDRLDESYGIEKLLAKWGEAVKAAGIKRIEGLVIGDATAFSTQMTPGNWGWEDMGNYYGAGASGLCFHENYYTLFLKPGTRAGYSTKVIRTYPAMDDIRFVNELTTGAPGSGDQAYIYGSPYTYLRYLRGSIPAGLPSFAIKGSIPEPAYLCASMLVDHLATCSIKVTEGASTVRREKLAYPQSKQKRTLIHTHLSPKLSEIVVPLNMKSINLYAECLLNAIAQFKGKKGSTQEGVAVVEAFWKEKGIDTQGMYMRDGSGLSPNNAVSTFQMAQILNVIAKSDHYAAFEQSLPLAGRSGSLKGMLKGTAAEGRLRAKSGFISGTRAYAGYVNTQAGTHLAFSMMANNFSCGPGAMRRKFERIMARLGAGK